KPALEYAAFNPSMAASDKCFERHRLTSNAITKVTPAPRPKVITNAGCHSMERSALATMSNSKAGNAKYTTNRLISPVERGPKTPSRRAIQPTIIRAKIGRTTARTDNMEAPGQREAQNFREQDQCSPMLLFLISNNFF